MRFRERIVVMTRPGALSLNGPLWDTPGDGQAGYCRLDGCGGFASGLRHPD